MTENIYKHRSAPACISAAYEMLLDNRKSILRKLFLPAIVFGISVTVCLMAYTPNKELNNWGLSHSTLSLLLLIGAVLLAFGATVWLVAATLTLLNGKGTSANMRRMLAVIAVFALYELLLVGAHYLCMGVVQWSLWLFFCLLSSVPPNISTTIQQPSAASSPPVINRD